MKISKEELIKVLSQFNPWWRGEAAPELFPWRRAAFKELYTWVENPPAPRAILLSGARQVGKTTLLIQVIAELIKNEHPAANILYVTFDHPIIKMAGIEAVIEAWREREPKVAGREYLFLDEAQCMRDWGTWIKHQIDFTKDRRIIFTGSAMPLIYSEQESGVGRWHTIKLPTLSFYEYLRLKESINKNIDNILLTALNKLKQETYSAKEEENSQKSFSSNIFLKDFLQEFLPPPALPTISSLKELFEWSPQEFYRLSELALPYTGHFHEYLVRGGFPQTIQINNLSQAQRLLREDIIDKVLKRDMTALFGVRRVLDLEQTFLYLCMHDGGLLDMRELCENLEVKRPTVQNFIELLEATHLIYRLQPFGYGKDILRSKYKIYLADAAIAPAVLLKGKSILEDPAALGAATETAVFKHVFARYYSQNIYFTYWRGSKNSEVDLVAELNNQIIPFEVKYRTQHTGIRELKELFELCQKKSIDHAYVITKSLNDFGPLNNTGLKKTKIMRIPAPLLCYWLGSTELSFTDP